MRRLTRDRTWAIALVLLAAAMTFAYRNGQDFVRAQRETIAGRRAEESARIAGLQAKIADLAAGCIAAPSSHSDPRKPSNVGGRLGKHWACLPPVPVAGVLAAGQSDLFPIAVAVTTRGKDTLEGAVETENPLHLLSGRLDPAFVLVYLFPLLVIALSYNLISEEREAGTLALVFSQPVSPLVFLWAKVAARVLLLVVPAALLTTLLPLLGGLFESQPVTADALARVGLSGLAVLLYGLFWLLVCALINTGRMASAGNAAALFGIWAVVTLVVPSALSEAAQLLYPSPSRAVLIERSRAASTEATERGSQILAQYYEDHPELAAAAKATPADPKDFSARRALVAEDVERAIAPTLAEYERSLQKQQAWTGTVGQVAPSVALLSALTDAAGTGIARRQHFDRQTDAFHEEWKSWFLPRTLRYETLRAATLSSLPKFAYAEEPTAAVVARLSVSLAALGITCLLPALTLPALLKLPR